MLNVLIAYPYLTPYVIEATAPAVASGKCRILVDSGAFTAWKSGKPVELSEYCDFIEKLPWKPWRYFTLDVIGDPAASEKNYLQMLARGLKPIPIFTRGEDIAALDRYYETSDVVGIGGLVGTQQNRGFVKGIMRHVGDRKVHWLGFTQKSFVRAYRPYSCDSSSVISANRFGQVELFDRRSGNWIKINKSDFAQRPPENIVSLLEDYGLPASDLARNSSWTGGKSISSTLSFRSHIRASIEFEQRIGTFYFLAPIGICSTVYVPKLIDAYEKETGCSLAPAGSNSAPATAS